MKRISAYIFVLSALFGTTLSVSAADNTKSDEDKILALISTLAQLTAKAEQCGEQLNFYGKKALSGDECKNFNTSLLASWPNREALDGEVGDYFDSVNQGKIKCSETCRLQLQRIEELRITIYYYLDYMEFMREF